MSDVIQCPQCDKKYRLPAEVPATFTCTNCSTVMDLSDFGGAEASIPPASSAPSGQDDGPKSRRTRAKGGARKGGGRRRSSAAAGRGGGGRGRSRGGAGRGRGRAAPEDEYDDEPSGRRSRPKKNNAPLIIGSAAAVMAIVIFIVISMKKDDSAPDGGTGTTVAGGPSGAGTGGASPGGMGNAAAATAGTAAMPTGGAVPGAAAGASLTAPDPSGGEDDTEVSAPRKPGRSGKGRYLRMSKVKMEVFPWAEDIDAETRAKAEEGIKAMYSGGRDWDDAQDWFVAQGRPLCGRLISEFKTIQDTNGLDNQEGKSYIGAIDSCLRKIDGWMERKWKELDAVRASSHPNYVIGSCRRWTWWWKYDEWKNNPRKPWDPFEDESDDTDTGIKAPEVKKEKKSGSGFGKRAGGG